MIRRAFTMRLKPGGLAEYKRNHDNIWQELVDEIERQGIAQITIFENDPDLFLYSEIRDQEAWDRLWHTEIHDKWGEVMNPLMVFNDEGIVDSSELREVFNLRTERDLAAKGEPSWIQQQATASRSSRGPGVGSDAKWRWPSPGAAIRSSVSPAMPRNCPRRPIWCVTPVAG